MLQTDREASNRLHQIETMLNHLQASRDQQNTVKHNWYNQSQCVMLLYFMTLQDSDTPQNLDYELLQELLKQSRDEQCSNQHAHYHE